MNKTIVSLVIVLTFAQAAFAQELVWKNSEHKLINNKIDSNPIYKVLRLRRDQRIERSELGTAISPYFKEENAYIRYFKSIDQCFKLSIYETKSLLTKAFCPKKFTKLVIKINDILATQVIPNKEIPKSIKVSNKKESFSYLAHTHAYDQIEDFDQLDIYPTQEITVDTLETVSVENTKGYIKIKNSVEVTRSKLGFLSAKTNTVDQKLSFDLYNQRDFIFKDNKNNFYFYKRYQPKPFTFSFLQTSTKFLDHLSNLDLLMYPFKQTKRCFRNDWSSESDFDCDTLIFKTVSPGAWYKMSLIKVNYNQLNFEILN